MKDAIERGQLEMGTSIMSLCCHARNKVCVSKPRQCHARKSVDLNQRSDSQKGENGQLQRMLG